MMRSRLIFVLLFLAYLGLTPAAVYTCACLMPAGPALHQMDLDEIPEQSSAVNTAVSTLLTFFSLTFMAESAFLLVGRRTFHRRFVPLWSEPNRIYQPPPTPPPHFA